MFCNTMSQILYLGKRDQWVCHRDMHPNLIKQKKLKHLSKEVPVKTGAGILRMPGIIPLNTPCRILPIKQ
jgi:hypothetical protein